MSVQKGYLNVEGLFFSKKRWPMNAKTDADTGINAKKVTS